MKKQIKILSTLIILSLMFLCIYSIGIKAETIDAEATLLASCVKVEYTTNDKIISGTFSSDKPFLLGVEDDNKISFSQDNENPIAKYEESTNSLFLYKKTSATKNMSISIIGKEDDTFNLNVVLVKKELSFRSFTNEKGSITFSYTPSYNELEVLGELELAHVQARDSIVVCQSCYLDVHGQDLPQANFDYFLKTDTLEVLEKGVLKVAVEQGTISKEALMYIGKTFKVNSHGSITFTASGNADYNVIEFGVNETGDVVGGIDFEYLYRSQITYAKSKQISNSAIFNQKLEDKELEGYYIESSNLSDRIKCYFIYKDIKITYKANNGTDEEYVVQYKPNDSLLDNMFDPVGDAEFICWIEEESGWDYQPKNVIITYEDCVYFAQWSKYPIIFDANGGKGEMHDLASEEYTLPTCTIQAPKGQEFAGYEIKGKTYAEGRRLKIKAVTYVTVLWKDINSSSGGSSTDPSTGDSEPTQLTPKKGIGAGGIVMIVLGSTIVLGLGGFSLYWFVIKKKNFNDLKNVFKKDNQAKKKTKEK